MTVKQWSAGDVLTAADMDAWAVPLAAFKTANTDRTTTTMSGDPDLTVSVAASAWYFVDAFLVYFCTSTTPHFKWTWITPAGAGAASYHAVYTGAGGSIVSELDLYSETHTAGVPVGSVSMAVTIRGTLLTSSAGSFQLSWAADSAVATMTLSARSQLKLTRTG